MVVDAFAVAVETETLIVPFNHFNNANYVTKVDHLCSERHTFNFLLKKVDFRDADPV